MRTQAGTGSCKMLSNISVLKKCKTEVKWLNEPY